MYSVVIPVVIGLAWLLYWIVSGSSSSHQSAQTLGPLEIRKVPFRFGEDESVLEGVGIELRGLIPVSSPTDMAFVTSVIDVTNYIPETDQLAEPVLSMVDRFQEAYTTAFQCWQDAGQIEPQQGYVDWVRVGAVFPGLLQPSCGGHRKLYFVCRLVDSDHIPTINSGFCQAGQRGIIAEQHVEYDLDYSGKGYKEAVADRDESRTHAISLAMLVAMSDGTLHDSEGHVIKHWVERTLASFDGEQREALKELYNNALRHSYAKATAGTLVLTEVIERMNEIAEEPQKYQAIALCYDVMSADGAMNDAEMHTIRDIAQALDLDPEELEALKDKALVQMNFKDDGQADADTLLGLDATWSNEQKRRHLAKLFAKWNDRLNAFSDRRRRDNAQRMLKLIAKARANCEG